MGEDEKEAYEYYKDFLKQHEERFEIVKTAHGSKWGDLQRSSYQMNNSFPCVDKEKLEKIAKVSIDYCNRLKIDHNAYIKHLRMNSSKRYSINNVLIALDNLNDNFKHTQYFKGKRSSIISDFKNKRLKLGKLLQYGDNLTICGNTIALLMKVTGQNFLEEGCFEVMEDAIQCYTTRFKDGERLAGFRSPHNSPNNIVHLVNNRCELIERYFPNLGNNVIVINGIGTDVQSRLNGQDLDTDAIYTTNQPEIVELAKYSYLKYPTIINDIQLVGDNKYKKDMNSYAEMDNKISSSQNATGEASNVAQLALSYYYDGECKSKELEDVFISCSVLAQISIDGAKREYDIDINHDLNRLKQLPCMKMEDGKKYPEFYAQVQKQKKLKNGKKKEIKDEEIRKFNCPMEILADIIEENIIDVRKYKEYEISTYDLNTVFQYKPDKIRDGKQYKKVISIVQNYDKEVKKLDETKEDYSEKVEMAFEDCMRKINKLTINKSTMSSLIAYAFANNGDIRDRLLVALYDRDAKKFLSCFKKTEKTPSKNAKSLENKGVEIFAYEEGHERNVG